MTTATAALPAPPPSSSTSSTDSTSVIKRISEKLQSGRCKLLQEYCHNTHCNTPLIEDKNDKKRWCMNCNCYFVRENQTNNNNISKEDNNKAEANSTLIDTLSQNVLANNSVSNLRSSSNSNKGDMLSDTYQRTTRRMPEFLDERERTSYNYTTNDSDDSYVHVSPPRSSTLPPTNGDGDSDNALNVRAVSGMSTYALLKQELIDDYQSAMVQEMGADNDTSTHSETEHHEKHDNQQQEEPTHTGEELQEKPKSPLHSNGGIEVDADGSSKENFDSGYSTPASGSASVSRGEEQQRYSNMNRVTSLLGQRMLTGWTLLAETCKECNCPLVQKNDIRECVSCNKKIDEQEADNINASKIQPVSESSDAEAGTDNTFNIQIEGASSDSENKGTLLTVDNPSTRPRKLSRVSEAGGHNDHSETEGSILPVASASALSESYDEFDINDVAPKFEHTPSSDLIADTADYRDLSHENENDDDAENEKDVQKVNDDRIDALARSDIEEHYKRVNEVSCLLGDKMLSGWTMLTQSCPNEKCFCPLVMDSRSDDKLMLCVACNQKYVTPDHPLAATAANVSSSTTVDEGGSHTSNVEKVAEAEVEASSTEIQSSLDIPSSPLTLTSPPRSVERKRAASFSTHQLVVPLSNIGHNNTRVDYKSSVETGSFRNRHRPPLLPASAMRRNPPTYSRNSSTSNTGHHTPHAPPPTAVDPSATTRTPPTTPALFANSNTIPLASFSNGNDITTVPISRSSSMVNDNIFNEHLVRSPIPIGNHSDSRMSSSTHPPPNTPLPFDLRSRQASATAIPSANPGSMIRSSSSTMPTLPFATEVANNVIQAPVNSASSALSAAASATPPTNTPITRTPQSANTATALASIGKGVALLATPPNTALPQPQPHPHTRHAPSRHNTPAPEHVADSQDDVNLRSTVGAAGGGESLGHDHVTVSMYEETMRDVMDTLVYKMDDARQQLLRTTQHTDVCAYAETISKLAHAIKSIQDLQQ